MWLDRDRTVRKACDLIRETGEGGADFVAFPENFIPAHPLWYYFFAVTDRRSIDFSVRLFENSIEIPSPQTDQLCRAAAEANVYVVIGVTERRRGTTGSLFNTQLFIDRTGRIIGKHQKLVPTIGERIVHSNGAAETLGPFETEYGPVSGLACGENSNPLALAYLASMYTRIHVASWPNHFVPGWYGMPDASLVASRNVAYMCKCYVISACGTISEEMVESLGHDEVARGFLGTTDETGGSTIIDPLGQIAAGPVKGNIEQILYHDADLRLAIEGHMVHDVAGHYNRPDVFQLSVRKNAMPLVQEHEMATSDDRDAVTEASETEDPVEFISGITGPDPSSTPV